MNDQVYDQIIERFDEVQSSGRKPSITQISKQLGVSEERVRRTLITEEKWESRTSKEILNLYRKGKTVSEIADTLFISEKNVQSYLPYTRGMYGGEQSNDAQRSVQYRSRMKNVEQNMNDLERKENEMEQKRRPATFLEHMAQEGNEQAQKAVEQWYTKLAQIQEQTDETWMKMVALDSEECKSIASQNEEYADQRQGVYQLRMDLAINPRYSQDEKLGMNEEEWQKFQTLANAKEGISRTVLVPGDMHLHALHYLIQRLFGWQNSHLHRFSLTEDDFQRVTAGRIGGWLDLCGTLFRHDQELFGDIYWDDDYRQGQSVKTWFKKKYMPPYRSLAVTDTFLYNWHENQKFEEKLSSVENMTPFTRDDLIEEFFQRMHPEGDMNTLLQRVAIKDLFILDSESEKDQRDRRFLNWYALEKGERENTLQRWSQATKKDRQMASRLQQRMKNLIILRDNAHECERSVWLGNQEWIREQTGMTPEQYMKMANQEITELLAGDFRTIQRYQPRVYPAFGTILYNYDYGDDWFVKISCEKVYLKKTQDVARDFYGYPVTESNTKTVYIEPNGAIPDSDGQEMLAEIERIGKPKCIAMDGQMLLDDVGGTHGFYQMLETLYGEHADPEERKEMKAWARGQGWTGKMPSTENLL